MNICIQSEQRGNQLDMVTFIIDLEGIKNAMKSCYLALGTLYDPIKIDDFVNIGKYAFSKIGEETTVSISLEPNLAMDHTLEDNDAKLICCKLNIVDKTFIDKGEKADSDHWEQIFKPGNLIYSAPDGTLYVSPDENKKCLLTSIEFVKDCNMSYSILISLNIEFEDEKRHPVYFILDPLVKVSGGGGRINP